MIDGEDLREQAMLAREGVSEGHRRLAYELAYQFRGDGSAREARRSMRGQMAALKADGKLKINWILIIGIIQFAMAVWRFLKEMGVLSSVESVDEIAMEFEE